MVAGVVVLCGGVLMARRADGIAFLLEPRCMRIVAVGTLDALVVHLALDKRSEDIDFIFDLAVGVVGLGAKQLVHKVVVVRRFQRLIWANRSATRVKARTFRPAPCVPVP